MKTEKLPALYKYFPPERVDVLLRKELRYTPLGAFNDPFEGRPDIAGLATLEETRAVLAKVLPEEIKRQYESLPHEFQRQLPFHVFSSYAETLVNVHDAHSMLQSAAPLLASQIPKKFDERLGALCLSEVPDSLLMWPHYAASHTGFVIEFDSNHPYFHAELSPQDEFRHLRRVLYRERRPSANLKTMTGVEMFLVKSGHWAYEREWRILRPFADASTVIPQEPFPVHLFAFPPDAVVGVILGARCSSETEEKLKHAISSSNGFSNPYVRRAVPDPTHFLLQIVDC